MKAVANDTCCGVVSCEDEAPDLTNCKGSEIGVELSRELFGGFKIFLNG